MLLFSHQSLDLFTEPEPDPEPVQEPVAEYQSTSDHADEFDDEWQGMVSGGDFSFQENYNNLNA